MDRVKIQEIADEAGLSNADLLEKAKDLGFDVKAANSTISMENAGILVDYAISGTLPKGFKKPSTKPKITVVKKKAAQKKEETPKEETPAVEEEAVESKTETPKAVEEKPAEEETPAVVEEVAEEKPAPKEVKKRKGISVVSKSAEPEVVLLAPNKTFIGYFSYFTFYNSTSSFSLFILKICLTFELIKSTVRNMNRRAHAIVL